MSKDCSESVTPQDESPRTDQLNEQWLKGVWSPALPEKVVDFVNLLMESHEGFEADYFRLMREKHDALDALSARSESERPPYHIYAHLNYTDAIVDAPRQLLTYAETPGRTLQGAREHLRRCGVKFEDCWPDWAYENGHLGLPSWFTE